MEKKFNPEAMYNDLLTKLEKTYSLCYVDQSDYVSPKTVKKCIDEQSPATIFDDDPFFEMRRYSAREELEKVIGMSDYDQALVDKFRMSNDYMNLVAEIEDRDDSHPERTVFERSKCHVRITLHSNYDCWLPLWETGSLYFDDTAMKGLLAVLCLNPAKVKKEAIRQGLECEGRWPNIRTREGNEIVSYKDFINNLYECPNYGLWSFFGTFDMKALWKKDFNTDGMTIPKDTVCFMFNSWNGGGSCAQARTLRDVTIKELIRRGAPYHDTTRVYVDERGCSDGYTSRQVYGPFLSDEIALTTV